LRFVFHESRREVFPFVPRLLRVTVTVCDQTHEPSELQFRASNAARLDLLLSEQFREVAGIE